MQVEGIYTAEPRFEAKAKALKLKQEMAAAAAEEQRAQKEKQYAQERNYGGGFGSGSAYMAGEKPQKTTNTGFSGGQRGGFGGKQHSGSASGERGGFSDGQRSGFGGKQRDGFGSGERSGFSSEQRGGFGNRERSGFSSEQRGGFSNRERSGFSSEQRGGFGSGERSGFGSKQRDGFGSGERSGFSSEQRGGFGNRERSGFSSEQRGGFSNRERSGFSSEQRGGFGSGERSGFGSRERSGFGGGGAREPQTTRDTDTVNQEHLENVFLGGAFLTGMAKVNGYAIGASAALDEAHTRHYAELLVEKAGKSLDSNVQRAATELQDQLDFGSAPTEKDIGHLVSVLDKAGETNVVDNVIREVEHDPLDTKNMESATEENAENGQVVEAEEDVADFDDLYEQMYPDSVDPYSKIRYNSDGTIVVTDDWTNIAHPRVNAKYRPNAVVDVISHQGQRDRIIYDENGYFKTFIHGGDHGLPKYHQYGEHGEHVHEFTWIPGEKHPREITRELTDLERIQYADIIKEGRR